ncbi:MAG: Eco47II family restriction endonuclease [Methylococcales bacterium]|nr:Eco47II family restriction endonuclease [Methylococcales bacterium]
MAYLNWITDEALKACVREVLTKGLRGISNAEKNFYRNGVDPFSAVFDAACQNISLEQWLHFERTRQAQKTLQNALGNFHQKLLANVNDWEIPELGFVDLVSDKTKRLAEIKNKHNTVKKSDLKAVYDELQAAVLHKTSKYHGYTSYYVTVIPASKKRFVKEFTPSDNETKTVRQANNHILEIDGYSFYALVTSEPEALKQLYQVLPAVIKDVLAEPAFANNPLSPFAQEPLFTELFTKAFG